MMAVVCVQGDEMNFMLEGCDLATAAQMMNAAANAIRDKLAAEGQPVPRAAPVVPPRPPLYLPNGHGHIPPIPPGSMQ